MNLATLKGVVASYHEKDVADLTKNGVDLFLVAANNARKNAEKLHTFEMMRCVARLDIDGALGGQLSDAIIEPPDIFARVKEVIAVSLLNNTVYVPVDFTRADIEIERERSALELSWGMWPENRYPSDQQFVNNEGCTKVVQRGNGLYLYPRVALNNVVRQPFQAYLECYGFLNDYNADSLNDPDEFDFFLQHGDMYMQWAIIDELNYLFQTYVPRQEGNVIPSPKDKRDEAWRDLLLWDTYMIDSHITRTK